MICTHCGRFVKDGSYTCEYCGHYLHDSHSSLSSDSSSMRQGRRRSTSPRVAQPASQTREYGDYELSQLPADTAVPTPDREESAPGPSPFSDFDLPLRGTRRLGSHNRYKSYGGKAYNWALLFAIAAVVGLLAFVGYRIYNANSEEGQRAAGRKTVLSATEEDILLAGGKATTTEEKTRQEEILLEWNELDPNVYWEVGKDYLGIGDVTAAIKTFRIADILDPENYDGLLELGEAYELNLQFEEAENVYLSLINDVAPARSDAYSALILLYQNQERNQDAGDMMLTAYKATDKETFRLQRRDFIPNTPQVDLSAGRYELSDIGLKTTKTNEKGEVVNITQMTVSSPQGFDVYYTLDPDAVLPDEGKLVERVILEDGSLGYAGIILEEGTITVRAVAVSGSLHSDELQASYTFYYPTPAAPAVNLAPGTYKTLHTVKLRPGVDESMTKKEKAEAESYYRYYYTVDGSPPSTNSPEYDDSTGIALPTGRVTLRAICVNRFGKESAIREVGYKFTVAPYLPEIWTETDVFTGFTLNKTSVDEFIANFGSPTEQLDTVYYKLQASATHLTYPWGYAVFILNGNAWQLVRVEMNRHITTGPRGTDFGMTESEIIANFRDYGQLPNADGTRGLYYSLPSVGKIIFRDDGTRVIQYQLETGAGKMWYLQYWLSSSGTVNKIIHFYQP